jgi:hypothetical protein
MKNKEELDKIENRLSKVRNKRSNYQKDINEIASKAEIDLSKEPKEYQKIVVSVDIEDFKITIRDD